MENTYLLPKPVNSNPDEERELAIIFLDIRNFTGLMESQSEPTAIQIVRRMFTAFNQIVKKFEGKVVEMAGDNMYIVFGLQTELKLAVNNAYQAAKMIFKTLGLFNEAYTDLHQTEPLEIGLGLHAGKVYVGEFGLDNNKQLSIMGLPVNIAARLQTKTKELNNDMIISEYAYQFIANEKVLAPHQTVLLQGITTGQQIRLAGKPYGGYQNFDYLLAISG